MKWLGIVPHLPCLMHYVPFHYLLLHHVSSPCTMFHALIFPAPCSFALFPVCHVPSIIFPAPCSFRLFPISYPHFPVRCASMHCSLAPFRLHYIPCTVTPRIVPLHHGPLRYVPLFHVPYIMFPSVKCLVSYSLALVPMHHVLFIILPCVMFPCTVPLHNVPLSYIPLHCVPFYCVPSHRAPPWHVPLAHVGPRILPDDSCMRSWSDSLDLLILAFCFVWSQSCATTVLCHTIRWQCCHVKPWPTLLFSINCTFSLRWCEALALIHARICLVCLADKPT